MMGRVRENLLELLRAFRPQDARDRHDLDRMLALAEGEPDPFARTLFAPGHFTASAWILAPDRDEVLLILHRKLGLWLQPGGHIEDGDSSVAHSARREAEEETGVQLETPETDGLFDIDIHRIPAHGDEPEHEHFDLRFLLRAADRELILDAEIRDARWVLLASVSKLGTDESVCRMADRTPSRQRRAHS
jgi:8-oxo-dGTP pyrophosphatase MutT (NUDIX family)